MAHLPQRGSFSARDWVTGRKPPQEQGTLCYRALKPRREHRPPPRRRGSSTPAWLVVSQCTGKEPPQEQGTLCYRAWKPRREHRPPPPSRGSSTPAWLVVSQEGTGKKPPQEQGTLCYRALKPLRDLLITTTEESPSVACFQPGPGKTVFVRAGKSLTTKP